MDTHLCMTAVTRVLVAQLSERLISDKAEWHVEVVETRD